MTSRISLYLAAFGACLTLTASAATVSWTGAGGTDLWSNLGNWTGGSPGSNDVIFGNADATGTMGAMGPANSIVDTSMIVSSLRFTNQTSVSPTAAHSVEIPAGVTLTLNSGANLITVATATNVLAELVQASIFGAGKLALSNTAGIITVGQGANNTSTARNAILDLSGLDTLEGSLSRIILGRQTDAGNRPNATIYLAKTNLLTLSYNGTVGGLQIGEVQSNNGTKQEMFLGQSNVINVNSIQVGGRKSNASLRFGPTVFNGHVVFRSSIGTGRVSLWTVGDNSVQSGGGTYSTGLMDFNNGTVDAMVDTMYLGRTMTGVSTTTTPCAGTLTAVGGLIDVNNLYVGYQMNANANACVGTLNLDQAASMVVNNNLVMGYFQTGTNAYTTTAAINIGTLGGAGSLTVRGDLLSGGSPNTSVTVGFGGSLTVGGRLGVQASATNTALSALNLTGGSLTFDFGSRANPVDPVSAVTNLNIDANTTIHIRGGGLTNGVIPLIKCYSGAPAGILGYAGLALGTLPLRCEAVLSNNADTIYLVITNTSSIKWSGAVNENWDIDTTANWALIPGPGSAKYLQPTVPGESVLFEDSAARGTVQLITALSPGGMVVDNNSLAYTFTGAGSLAGATVLTKRGSGSLTLANSASNTFSGGLVVEAGSVLAGSANPQLFGTATVTLSNASGVALNLNGYDSTVAGLVGGGGAGGNVALGNSTLTIAGGGSYSGAIGGSGSVVKTGAGTQNLRGADTYTGGTTVVEGVLALENTSASAFLRVETNGFLLLGNNGGSPTLAAASITNHGTLRFNSTNSYAFTIPVTGDGILSKYNTNTVLLAAANTHTGQTAVVNGALRPVHPNALGDLTGVTYIGNLPGARLELSGGLTFQEGILLNCKQGNDGPVPGLLNVDGTNTLAGQIELTTGGSSWIIESAAGRLNITGPLTNSTIVTANRTLWLRGAATGEIASGLHNSAAGLASALRKDDVGTWILSGTSTHTGATTVSNGTLVVDGAITSGQVLIYGGTLAGTGTLGAPVLVGSLGTLAPGASIGTLTVNNTLTNNGTLRMEVSSTGADKVMGITTLALGGTLKVEVVGSLAGGESFQLFQAGAITGDFATYDLPALSGGLTWNTNDVPINGTLKVNPGTVNPPTIGSITVAGGNLVISGTGGVPGAGYSVLTATDVAAPLASWLLSTNGTFDAGGAFSVTNTVNPAESQRYFRLSVP